ncbi:hypothetical protein SAMN05421780_101564 [Flexibacter flexilis DSM 6793]|uniref:Uncharacterized protein n=1 Tax=Flexibacter flexilis DSM 6793 TaxID=927664 RepID=A0A1I1E0G3_9BACT|nr:hypothetical protein [Flexibacter flexilis]SFB80685.1 hypothetical protein SAMN05421780_101564 [Flexibacter flexilis DSM 6793]
MRTDVEIEKICRQILRLSPQKIRVALCGGLIIGAFKSLTHYNIELNDNSFNIFVAVVGEKLSGNKDIEYEWLDEEYNMILEIRQAYL